MKGLDSHFDQLHAEYEARRALPDEIAEYYDSHPDVTLAEMARIFGLTVYELKKILMPGY